MDHPDGSLRTMRMAWTDGVGGILHHPPQSHQTGAGEKTFKRSTKVLNETWEGHTSWPSGCPATVSLTGTAPAGCGVTSGHLAGQMMAVPLQQHPTLPDAA